MERVIKTGWKLRVKKIEPCGFIKGHPVFWSMYSQFGIYGGKRLFDQRFHMRVFNWILITLKRGCYTETPTTGERDE